jgi:hypothetical protein
MTRGNEETQTMTRTMIALVGGLGAVLASGCELALPILLATSGGGSPGYDEPYAYEDQQLEVQLIDLRGRVGDRALDMPMGELDAQGSQYGASANFALTRAPETTESADDDVYVMLDVCPIDEYADGGPISDPSSAYLGLTVCNGFDCRDGWDSTLEIEVADAGANRDVTAHASWEDGSEVTLALRYALPAR